MAMGGRLMYTWEFEELMIRSIDTFNETAHQLFPDDNNNDNGKLKYTLLTL